jgi:hypothetical protein
MNTTRRLLATLPLLAVLTLGGCGAVDDAKTAAGVSSYLTEEQLESSIRDDGAYQLTGADMQVQDVECDRQDDKGAEWSCDMRSLGEKEPTTYFVEVTKNGEWAAQVDMDAEGDKVEKEMAEETAEYTEKLNEDMADMDEQIKRETEKACIDAGLSADCT